MFVVRLVALVAFVHRGLACVSFKIKRYGIVSILVFVVAGKLHLIASIHGCGSDEGHTLLSPKIEKQF